MKKIVTEIKKIKVLLDKKIDILKDKVDYIISNKISDKKRDRIYFR